MSAPESKKGIVLAAQQCSVGEMECECDSDMFQVLRAGDDGSDPKVIYQLGQYYHFGWGTVRDLKAAIKCYGRAAELGSFEALWRLWKIRNDQSVKTDLQDAFRAFNRKADQGNSRAQFNAGYCHYWGITTSQDKAKARDLFMKAADQGCADAMWMLEECRQKRVGDGYNGMRGIELLKYAAELGSAEAQYELGYSYYNGRTSYGLEVEKDHKQAAEWYQKAADQNHTEATCWLARCYCYGYGVQKDVKKAFQLFKKAALMGYGQAQYHISAFYSHKMSELSENDYPVSIDFFEAVYWNRKAVNQDQNDARESTPNILKAIELTQHQINKLMKQTSSFEFAKILYSFTRQYETCRRVRKDEKKVFQMYRLSARFGSTQGQVALAISCEQGIGTEKNILYSMCWNIRAAMQGNKEASQALKKWLQQSRKQSEFKHREQLLTQAINALKDIIPQHDHNLEIIQLIVEDDKEQFALLLDFFNKGQDPPDNADTFETCKLAVEYDMRAVYWMVRHYQHSINIIEDFAGIPQRLQDKIDSGEAEVVYYLAKCFMYGLGLQKNEVRAVNLLKFAVNEGHSAAQYELGRCYQEGTVVERSIDKAIELYNKAAEQQYIPALKILADIYESEDYRMKDLKQAFEYRKTAAQLGDADEQVRVAECYKGGIGVEQDDRKALCWFQKAVRNGKYQCYKQMAECYEQGIGTVVNLQLAFKTYKRLATALPTEDNLIILAERFKNGIGTQKDVTAAIKYYQQAGAHSKLGDIYFTGNGVPRSFEIALNYYKRAEEFNLIQLQNIMCIFTICCQLQRDGLFYFKVLKLTALALRNEIFKTEIIV